MPRLKGPEGRKRLNLQISDSVRSQIEELREKTNSDSMTEVVRRAILLLDYVVTAKKSGAKVILQHKNGTETSIELF